VLFLFAHKVVSVKEEDLTKKYDNKFIFYAEAGKFSVIEKLNHLNCVQINLLTSTV
jgi:hypothetical protein